MRSLNLNYKQEHILPEQNLASYATGLAVIMTLVIGDAFAIIAITMMLDIITRFGLDVFIIGMMVIGGFASIVPNIVILLRGSATFVKVNLANCVIQILISFLWFLSGYHDLILLNMVSFMIPVVCYVLIRSEPYQRFVAFYFQLHVERLEYRRIIKDAAIKK
jgi:hypothetical protein